MINGKVVLEYNHPKIGGFNENTIGVVPAYCEQGKLLESGDIALQSEGQSKEFENVRSKNLN